MTVPRSPRARCAVHPGRPAVDTCPVCDRLRCGADAAAGPGCRACDTATSVVAAAHPAPGDVERLTRAGLASYAVALLGGLVASEYVGATVFSYLGPFVVGVICGGAATKAAGTDGRGQLGTRVRALAALVALLGVALSFVVEGSLSALSLDPDVLLPYAAAVAGAVLWTIPPRSRQGRSTEV